MFAVSDQNSSLNFHSTRLNDLCTHFGGKLIITRKQLREFLQISVSTEWRMFKSGAYPRYFTLPNGIVRIELNSLAEWLENGGSKTAPVSAGVNAKKRGRPIGSRNKRTNSVMP